MIILFDLTAIYDHLTGIERYAINISKNIIYQHPENQYVLVFKNEVHQSFVDIVNQENVKTEILQSCHKLIFNQWRLMKRLYHLRADKYVFLSFTSPWLFRKKGIINTIHDISAWDCPGTRKWYMVLYGRLGIRNAIKVSESIITVSKFSQSRLIDRLHVDSKKVHVVYNGVSDQFLATNHSRSYEEISKKYNLPSKYLLCLSTLEPRKNMKLLIEAYLELKAQNLIDYSLVLAGRKGWKLEDVLGKYQDAFKKSVVLTGFIDDEDLPQIYSNAEAFVFPSLYEGFGIPIIEAMSCGTVVISSDSSSLPEVVGNAGILFQNGSKDALKRSIISLSTMTVQEKEDLIEKGYTRFKQFSWSNESENYYKVLLKEY